MESRLKHFVYKGTLFGFGVVGSIAIAWAATFNLFQPANGILVGNPNTYVTSAATFSNVAGLWTGTNCGTTTNVPQLNGNCINISTAFSSANPSATVGLTAVNGTAATYMTSDSAPPLSQSIAPTMTGVWTFTPSSGIGVTINGVSNTATELMRASTTSGQSLGLLIDAGTTSADYALKIQNASASSTFLETFGDGGTVAGAATGGDKGAGTINAVGLYVNGVAVSTGGTPGGTSGQIQYNNSGAFGGTSMTYATSGAFTIPAPTSGTSPALTITAIASAKGLFVNGASGAYTIDTLGASASGNSFGIRSAGGTTSADQAFIVQNQAESSTFEEIFGDGHGILGPNTTNDLSWSTAGAFTIASPTGGVAFTVNASSGNYAELIQGSGTAGNNFGLRVQGGLSSGDASFVVQNSTSSATYMEIFGDGHGTLGPSASLGISWATTGVVVLAAPSSAAVEFVVNGASGNPAGQFVGNATSGNSYGLNVLGGTTSADRALGVYNQAGSVQYMAVQGDGGMTIASPTGGDKGTGTLNTAGDIFINNVPQRMSSLSAQCTSSGCTTTVANGFSTSITRSSTGVYALSFSPSYGSAPVCVVGSFLGSSSAYGTSINVSPSQTGVTVGTFSGSASADENFSIICQGI
jgi:hypothetical protein